MASYNGPSVGSESQKKLGFSRMFDAADAPVSNLY